VTANSIERVSRCSKATAPSLTTPGDRKGRPREDGWSVSDDTWQAR
jgi:hypothetical protein